MPAAAAALEAVLPQDRLCPLGRCSAFALRRSLCWGKKGRKIPPFALGQGETEGWTHEHPPSGPSFCPGDVFWDMKALGLHPRPRCWRLRGPAAPTAPAVLAQGGGKGRGAAAKIGKWNPEKVSMCVDSSKAQEGFREKKKTKITSYG